MSGNVLHLLGFGCLNGDNKSMKDYNLIVSNDVYLGLSVGTSAINVKLQTLYKECCVTPLL